MTVVELVQELRRLKVNISARNARLVVDAPSGVITPALAREIKANKAQLLELIESVGDAQLAAQAELIKAPDEDRLSLTQTRIWAIDQLNPQSSQFNLPGAWWLDGSLDVEVLSRAIGTFESHHDIFRRRFISSDGSPRVSAPDQPGIDFRFLTLQDIGLKNENPERLTQWFENISAKPFDLSKDALLRIVLLSVNETRHLLSVISHSIVWDAWCYDLFLAEVGATYEALLAGTPVSEPRHQYTDFVHWQRIQQESPSARKVLENAISSLQEYVQRMALPHIYPAPSPKDHTGARYNFAIPVELREKLRAFSREKGVTPFMVFLSAYAFLLCRYAGRDKVLLTIPHRGRERKEFETIPGPFTNNLFFPIDTDKHTFLTLLTHIKRETGLTFGGEVPSFERLIEAINQNLADSAFFQLQFSYQNVQNRGTHWAEGIRMSAGPAHNSDNAHAEISFWMREGKENMDGAIDYRTSMFDEAFIAEFFQRLLAVIESAIATPDARLQDLGCGAPANTDMAIPRLPATHVNALEDLRTALTRQPENVVVLSQLTSLSAGRLLDAIDTAQDSAVERNTDATAELVKAVRDLASGTLSIENSVRNFSSEAINTAIGGWQERFAEGCESVLIALPGHTTSRAVAWLAVLASGRRLCLPTDAEAVDEISLLKLIRHHKPQLVLLPSPIMDALLEMDDLPLEPDYLIWTMPGASQLQERITAKALRVRYLIASDATLGMGLIGSGDDWPLTFSQREHGIAARVLDSYDRDQLSGLNGRLALSLLESPQAGTGPGITARLDRKGQIRWPDLDPVDESGIEHVANSLLALDSVQDVFVEARRSNPARPAMVAWVEQVLGREMSNTQMRRALRAVGVSVPLIIISVDQIPRDRNHVVLREALDHPDEVPAHSQFEPPATDAEIAFAAIWKDVLSTDRISVNDTFANLGGSSVQALVVLSETRKQLGYSFEPRLLFFQSLKQIAATFPVCESAQVAQ